LRTLALGVALAAQEPPVLAPLLDHHRPALVAGDVRLLGLGLPRGELLRLVELLPEALVEALEELPALELAGADLVELLLHLRGEVRIHEVEVRADEAVDHELAQHRRREPAARELLDIGPLLDLADDLRVRRGAADAALLELPHQRALVVARRRLGELLLGDDARRGRERQ